jgi:hypothetical protein
MTERRREALLAAGTACVALAVYLRTMYPGLVGIGDSPELQFAGAVLGTGHTPGYPFYMVVCWAFSHLRIGPVAFRTNLVSVVGATIATALLVLVLRRLGCRRVVAAAVALSFALGPVYWSQATVTEVYALASAILLAVVLTLLQWEATRREGWLIACAALTGLGLGHHYVDLVSAGPGLLAFILMVDRRALRPRVLAKCVGLLALGLAQYAYVVLRTMQGAPYLGSRATTPAQLWAVISAKTYNGYMFDYTFAEFLRTRLPAFIGFFAREMGPAAVGLFFVGVAALLRRNRPRAVLFLLSSVGPLAFAFGFDVPDVPVFLIPNFCLVWPVVGIGLEAVVSAVETALRAETARRVVAPIALLLPLAQLVANYRVSDHHARTFETRYFRGVAEALAPRSAVVTEIYTVDQMMRYEILGEGFGRVKQIALSGRDRESIDAYLNKGYTVFAFEQGRRALEAAGFAFAPVDLPDRPLAAAVEALPAGSVVALAAAAGPQGQPAVSAALRAVGAEAAFERGCAGAIGTVGGKRGGLGRVDPESVDVGVAAGQAVGGDGRAPVALRALCRGGAVAIETGGRRVAGAPAGGVAVAVNTMGRVVERLVARPGAELWVPFTRRAFPLYRLTRTPSCLDVGGRGWVDVSTIATQGRVLGKIDDARPFEASLVLYLGSARPLRPRLAETYGRGKPRVTSEEFVRSAPGADAELRQALTADGLGAGPLLAQPFVSRLEVTVNDEGESAAAALDLGGVPALAFARAHVDRNEPRRAGVCGLPAGGVDLLAVERTATLSLGSDGAALMGAGWHDPERDGPVEFRWTAEPEAELLLPLANAGPLLVRVQAMAGPAATSEAQHLGLRVNGVDAGERTLGAGWGRYEWMVPAAAWRRGLNVVGLRSSPLVRPTGEARRLGLAVSVVEIEGLTETAAPR